MFRETRTPNDSTDRDLVPPDGMVPLEWMPADVAALDPEAVRGTILAQHQKIRALLTRLESTATALLACAVSKPRQRRTLRRLALHLCQRMSAHVAFENQILVPVVQSLDAWGPVRAQNIIEEHAGQLQLLQAYTNMLANDTESSQSLALSVWQLVQNIAQDMQEEEAGVLSAEWLSDRAIGQDVETG